MPSAGVAKAPPPREETDSHASDTGRTESSAPTTGRRGRRPLRNHKGCVQRGGQRRPPLQGRTGTVRSGTSRTPSPTHSVIARSEATRQSVLPSPKRRIPVPVTRSLARNDSAARWARRDTWVPPYGVRRSSRADRVVRPYKAKQEPCETGRRGRRPLHTLSCEERSDAAIRSPQPKETDSRASDTVTGAE